MQPNIQLHMVFLAKIFTNKHKNMSIELSPAATLRMLITKNEQGFSLFHVFQLKLFMLFFNELNLFMNN